MHKIAVIDFGGQYAHLIANKVRRLNCFSEVLPHDVLSSQLVGFKGIIFSGGPSSVYDKEAPLCDPKILECGVPILGICYGHQLISNLLGGQITNSRHQEYGLAILQKTKHPLLDKMSSNSQVWMSHGDEVKTKCHRI